MNGKVKCSFCGVETEEITEKQLGQDDLFRLYNNSFDIQKRIILQKHTITLCKIPEGWKVFLEYSNKIDYQSEYYLEDNYYPFEYLFICPICINIKDIIE